MKRIICFLVTVILMMSVCITASAAGNSTVNGNNSVTVGNNIELTVNIEGCGNATSVAVVVTHSDDFELVSGTWIKNGSISVFDVSTKKGALGVLSSPNVNGNLFKIVLKAKTSSMQSQNVGVNVIAKNDLTEILNVNSSKLIKINCATHSCGTDYICDVCGFVDCNIEEMFSDVSNDAWYSEALTYAVSTGLLKGYTNGKFGTSDGIQRQDFLVMLARFDGADLTAYANNYGNFTDVSADSYYEAAVNWGKANNIVNGYVNGAFGVGDKITREQIVTFMYRYARYKGLDTSVTPSAKQRIQNRYYDFRNVSDFAMDAIYWAIDRGVINGKENNTAIVPQGNAQRCEVAQIMFNIHKNNIF